MGDLKHGTKLKVCGLQLEAHGPYHYTIEGYTCILSNETIKKLFELNSQGIVLNWEQFLKMIKDNSYQ